MVEGLADRIGELMGSDKLWFLESLYGMGRQYRKAQPQTDRFENEADLVGKPPLFKHIAVLKLRIVCAQQQTGMMSAIRMVYKSKLQ